MLFAPDSLMPYVSPPTPFAVERESANAEPRNPIAATEDQHRITVQTSLIACGDVCYRCLGYGKDSVENAGKKANGNKNVQIRENHKDCTDKRRGDTEYDQALSSKLVRKRPALGH